MASARGTAELWIHRLRMPLQGLVNIVSQLRVRNTKTVGQLDLLSLKVSVSTLI